MIGTGYWGRNLVRNFHELQALAAVCDSDQNRLQVMAERYAACPTFTDYASLLQEDSIAAVAIATPAESHAALVRETLTTGKDVFVEKPLCLSVSEGEELVALADRLGRILMVGHLLWYHSAVLRLRELIDGGELGRIQHIYSSRLNLGRIRREENILWSFAPHDISVILGLLGEMPDAVHAQGGNYLHPNIADVTVSLLSFPSGGKAHIFVSWLHPYKEQKLIVVGDRAMTVFDDVEQQDKLLLYSHSIEWRNHVPVPNRAQARPIAIEQSEPLQAECRHFLDCVRTRCRPRTDGEEGLRVLRVVSRCQAALEGTQNGRRAEAPQTRGYVAHESAFIDEGAEIGEGTMIWHVSHVLKGLRIGRNCRIGQNVAFAPLGLRRERRTQRTQSTQRTQNVRTRYSADRRWCSPTRTILGARSAAWTNFDGHWSGGAGLIGSHVVDQLLSEPVSRIVVYDNFVRGRVENLTNALKDPRVKIFDIGGDILQTDILEVALEGADVVFHLDALWLLQCHDFPRSALTSMCAEHSM